MPALLTPPPHVARLGLRAMKTVALGAGELRPGARRLLEAACKLLLRIEADLDVVEPIEPHAFAEGLGAKPLREQIVRAMVILSLVDGAPIPGVTERARAFAAALEIDEPSLHTAELFAQGHMVLGRLDWLRRSHLRDMAKAELDGGLFHAAKALLGARGLLESPEIAAPYLAMADLPDGTLGKALFGHYRSNGFSLPGEKLGFPEAGVYHDLTHVLGGYGTDPRGELQVGAFTAGFRKKDPIFVAMLPLLLFCADINVTPIPHEHVDALFSQPDVAESFFRAHERGAKMKLDLSEGWDYWPHIEKPLTTVRAELGIE